MQLELLQNYAENLQTDDYLTVVDGYDVVLSGSSDLILTKFDQLTSSYVDGPSVVFQADFTFYCPLKNATISAYYANNYPPHKQTIYRYLSSGGMMGKAGSVAKLVRTVQERYKDDDWDAKSDQSLFIRYLVDDENEEDDVRIIVDHWQTIFSGNGGRVNTDFDIVGGRLHHKVTDSFPVMLHCPGRKKNQLEMIRLKELGWEADVMSCE